MVVQMKAAHYFILLVIALFLVAAAALFPRREEHVAVLAGEGRHKEAIALLERRLAEDPDNPELLAALGRSYAALGEIHRAIDVFEAYLKLRPVDVPAREKQADLLLQSGAIDRYLDAMAQAVATQPTPSRITRLVELYRLHGRFDEELPTLKRYAGIGMLDTPQLERLGALLAERAEWREARLWLERADRQEPHDAAGGRLLLLDVLMRDDKVGLAYRRARVWMTAWRSPFLSGKLILHMAQSGLAAASSRLALEFAEMMPQSTFDMAGLFVRKGHPELAQQMLIRWSDRATNPTKQELRAFVHTSALMGNVNTPLVKLVQLVQSGADPAMQARLAEELANTFGFPALEPVRPLLTNDVLLARPLFAAQLSLFEGNREMARWFLNRAEPAHLSPERAEVWFSLLRRAETADDVFDRLARLWKDGRLPAELVPQFADQARRLGHLGMHDAIWESFRQ